MSTEKILRNLAKDMKAAELPYLRKYHKDNRVNWAE